MSRINKKKLLRFFKNRSIVLQRTVASSDVRLWVAACSRSNRKEPMEDFPAERNRHARSQGWGVQVVGLVLCLIPKMTGSVWAKCRPSDGLQTGIDPPTCPLYFPHSNQYNGIGSVVEGFPSHKPDSNRTRTPTGSSFRPPHPHTRHANHEIKMTRRNGIGGSMLVVVVNIDTWSDMRGG